VQLIAPTVLVGVLSSKTSLSPEVIEYVAAAIASATRRAYQGDLKDFILWGGCVPCTPGTVAEYIANRARIHSPFTIARRIVGISRAHTSLEFPDPSKSDLVRAVLRGLRRTEGKPQRQVAPVLREDLFPMLEQMRGLKGIRDRALLLVGFATALRRSELVGLNVEDLQFVKEGLLVHLPRSKTDQKGEGRKIAIPFGRTSSCPVKAVQHWMNAATISTGPVFRSVSKAGAVSFARLSDQSVALIVKQYARALGLPAEAYSGHSLRAGLVTSAAKAGVSLVKIQQQTGHRSVAMLSRYIRDAQVFENNAAGLLL
jgi:integrase